MSVKRFDDAREAPGYTRLLGRTSDVSRQTTVEYGLDSAVPDGDPPSGVDAQWTDAGNVLVETRTQSTGRPSGSATSIDRAWLLDPAISAQIGMLVKVHGSRQFRHGIAWHGGDYEGAQGVVHSVHKTGVDNESFPSTARVKFLKPLDPSNDTLSVPVSLLLPVQPDAVEQHALIVGGAYKGHTAKLLEEVSEHRWFVAAAYDYFEVGREDLVRVMATDT
ncbi:hypothetical protein C8Q77DRAFT_897149 [Trametes polyzona]|nr:hypothetical protein C8Q77DRAFT_897149 [Trametes polyzona]